MISRHIEPFAGQTDDTIRHDVSISKQYTDTSTHPYLVVWRQTLALWHSTVARRRHDDDPLTSLSWRHDDLVAMTMTSSRAHVTLNESGKQCLRISTHVRINHFESTIISPLPCNTHKPMSRVEPESTTILKVISRPTCTIHYATIYITQKHKMFLMRRCFEVSKEQTRHFKVTPKSVNRLSQLQTQVNKIGL